ncbi:hypothetical protein H0H93_007426 [Arthromyces matolae]|nr:hypothetical protein H0H93_007426 [Arthromyces matolae]
MMHVDLLFALTEEKDFKDSDVATLEQQIEKDRTEFAKFVETERDGNLAKACLRRLSYYKAVLGNKDRVVITPPPPIPGHANVDKDEYTKFVQSTIEIKLPNRRSLADRITYVGLNYIQAKLERSLDVSFEVKWFEVFVKEFDGGGDEEKDCQARAKYYKELIQQLTDKVV